MQFCLRAMMAAPANGINLFRCWIFDQTKIDKASAMLANRDSGR
jgi:hypothetical protein